MTFSPRVFAALVCGLALVWANSGISAEASTAVQPATVSAPNTLTASGAVAPSSWLANASVRAVGGAGDRTLIAGFVIEGNGRKPILVRGVGPALTALGVNGVLPNPAMDLYDLATRQLIARNSGWCGAANATDIQAAAVQLGGFPLPVGSADSAVLTPLSKGIYSANISTTGGSPGVALLELYDSDPGADARFVNLSARTQVGTGEDILIMGFVIAGRTPKQVLLRGIGPSLKALGVAEALADPRLELHGSGGQLLNSNDDWAGSPAIAAAAAKVGAFPLPVGSKDAALLVTLPPGAYTVHVVGAGGSTGVALAELYDVPAPQTQWTMVNVSPNGQQADCHVITFPDGRVALIDVADAADANGAALSYLRAHGITKVDLVVISHFHVDHYGRLRDVINAGIQVDRVAVNMPALNASIVNAEAPWGFSRTDAESLLNFLRDRGVSYFTPYIGEQLINVPLPDGTSASLTAVCLYDGTNSPVGQTDTNDTSIIVKLTHGPTRALFTGDLNASLGTWLAGSSYDLSADLLKVPHHGTEGCAPDAFFDRVGAKAALVPSPAGLWDTSRSSRIHAYFANRQIPTYVSGIHGHVTVTMNAQGYSVGY